MQPAPLVLIVDDDLDTLRLYGLALELFGLDVVAAQSAQEALRAVEMAAPNIVVTDLAMPGMDGIEFCKRLKASEQTRDIPVLAVSGQAIEPLESRARAAGCREVLLKPCEPDTLFSTISHVLEESRTVPDPPVVGRDEVQPERRQVWATPARRNRGVE